MIQYDSNNTPAIIDPLRFTVAIRIVSLVNRMIPIAYHMILKTMTMTALKTTLKSKSNIQQDLKCQYEENLQSRS